MTRRVVVFTDLDGSLLDHDDYSWSDARDALERLRREGIPLVFNSSKTRCEILALRQELENTHPFVVENGAAIYVPKLYFGRSAGEEEDAGGAPYSRVLLGRDRREILHLLHEIRRRRDLRFTGFADLGAQGVSARTGLDEAGARAALERDGSEPLVWLDEHHTPEELAEELRPHRLRLVAGGRFFHVTGRADKGTATRWLIERYRTGASDLVTVAVGDSPNDLEMLRSADIGIVIPRIGGDRLDLAGIGRPIQVDLPGAAGWQQGIDRLFHLLETHV